MENLIHVGGKTKLFPNEVSYFEADENYTIIHYASGTKSIVPTTLKLIENRIGIEYGFIRPNRMHLINLEFIKDIQDAEISLKDLSKVVVSRRRIPTIQKMCKLYWEQFPKYIC